LHSNVAPVPFDDLLPQIEQALGRSPFEVFADLEREPYAAASIAQIHRAKLTSGAAVVLKIRRPGIDETIDADLRLLDRLARLVEHEMPEARRYRAVEIVGQLRGSLERELDLAVEARNTERFARNFADDLDILVPRVLRKVPARKAGTLIRNPSTGNGRGGGQAGKRASEDSCAVEAEDGRESTRRKRWRSRQPLTFCARDGDQFESTQLHREGLRD
jgi:hypothetical protein